MKYVVFQCTYKTGMVQKVPIVFPEFMVHKIVAEYMTVLLRREHEMTNVQPVSAGFVNLGGKGVMVKGKPMIQDGASVYGESESLRLKHDPDDGALINLYQYTNGLVS